MGLAIRTSVLMDGARRPNNATAASLHPAAKRTAVPGLRRPHRPRRRLVSLSEMRSPKVAIQTLGCKLNIADSEAMAHRFQAAGWAISKDISAADAIIINTCSVTRAADGKSRHAVRLAKRKAPGATIGLTGCL